MTHPILPKAEAAALIDAPVVWTTAALLGQHPLSAEQAEAIARRLGFEDAERRALVESLRAQPTRGGDPAAKNDPTIYRLHEALSVYGPALKALIHEEFGDGIMSAINFQVNLHRRPDPEGDRVVITLDGKFLDYRW
ncbi:cyanase [Corynebacterium mastitidis]|uniref:Cyanate hydratase n=1 Tax=Corynebacterium mastitidis TaxID=161890 RepID=A0ABU8NYT6_9CORY